MPCEYCPGCELGADIITILDPNALQKLQLMPMPECLERLRQMQRNPLCTLFGRCVIRDSTHTFPHHY